MAINKPGMLDVFKTAKNNNYEYNSDQTKLINKKTGSELKISETGMSVFLDKTRITEASQAKKKING